MLNVIIIYFRIYAIFRNNLEKLSYLEWMKNPPINIIIIFISDMVGEAILGFFTAKLTASPGNKALILEGIF